MGGVLEKGLIQIYTGDGKGKTTAALGLAFRALGHGCKVFIISFMKGYTYLGELYSAERYGDRLKIVQFGRGCSYAALIKEGFADCVGCGACFLTEDNLEERDKDMARQGFELAKKIICQGEYDIVVLDEICNTFRYGLLAVEEVVELLQKKPPQLEVILTGREAPQKLIDLAHLVTEMKAVKHPFDYGIRGRRGIEY